jgi:hypothetical protein
MTSSIQEGKGGSKPADHWRAEKKGVQNPQKAWRALAQ